jgi:hypothetical protein
MPRKPVRLAIDGEHGVIRWHSGGKAAVFFSLLRPELQATRPQLRRVRSHCPQTVKCERSAV